VDVLGLVAAGLALHRRADRRDRRRLVDKAHGAGQVEVLRPATLRARRVIERHRAQPRHGPGRRRALHGPREPRGHGRAAGRDGRAGAARVVVEVEPVIEDVHPRRPSQARRQPAAKRFRGATTRRLDHRGSSWTGRHAPRRARRRVSATARTSAG
jgi:hypothetical protein